MPDPTPPFRDRRRRLDTPRATPRPPASGDRRDGLPLLVVVSLAIAAFVVQVAAG